MISPSHTRTQPTYGFGEACATVELGEDFPGDAGGFGEESSLGEPVLSGGRIHDKESLVWCSRDQLFRCPAHFVELFHQVGLSVEATCRVDDQDLCAAGLGGGASVVKGG